MTTDIISVISLSYWNISDTEDNNLDYKSSHGKDGHAFSGVDEV